MKKILFCDYNKIFEELTDNLKTNLNKYNWKSNFENCNILIISNFPNKHLNLLKNKKILSKKIFCYLQEPLTLLDLHSRKIIKNLKKYPQINLITYSLVNLKILEKILPNRKYFLLPLNFYNYSDRIFEKTIPIVCNHRLNSKMPHQDGNYNNKIIPIEQIKDNNILVLNCWGKERENLFDKTQIFINLHRSEKCKILETLRIYNLIYHRIIIISQKCLSQNIELLSDYVIYVEDNKLIETALEINKNYDKKYQEIYGKKTNKEIFHEINEKYKVFLEELNF